MRGTVAQILIAMQVPRWSGAELFERILLAMQVPRWPGAELLHELYRNAGAAVGRLWAIAQSSLCDAGLRQAYLNIPMVRMGACCNAKPLLVHKRQRFVSQ